MRKPGQCGIYGIFNQADGKWYIGSSIRIEGRWSAHKSSLRRGCHDNSYLQRAWDKHGADSFEFTILHLCAREELSDREEFFMHQYRSVERDYGYNLESIVLARKNISPETRLKISLAQKGKKISEEQKQRLREAALRRPPISEETREKFRESSKLRKHTEATLEKFRGRKHTTETRLKMRELALKRDPVSEETRAKLRQASLGQRPANKGRKATEETRQKMRDSWAARLRDKPDETKALLKKASDAAALKASMLRQVSGVVNVTTAFEVEQSDPTFGAPHCI